MTQQQLCDPVPQNHYYYYGSTRQQTSSNDDDSASTLAALLGACLCFLLFCVILFSIAYPFTMYKEAPTGPLRFSEDKWWCYHCSDPSACGSKCW